MIACNGISDLITSPFTEDTPNNQTNTSEKQNDDTPKPPQGQKKDHPAQQWVASLRSRLLELETRLSQYAQRIAVMEDQISLGLPPEQKWQQANNMRKNGIIHKSQLSTKIEDKKAPFDWSNWHQTIKKMIEDHQYTRALYQIEKRKSEVESLPGETFYWQGRAYLASHKYSQAASALQQFSTESADSHPFYRKALFLEAKALYKLDRPNQSLKKLKQILSYEKRDQLSKRATELASRIGSSLPKIKAWQ